MDITIHMTFLPHDDPDASLAFYRDTLGFEVRNVHRPASAGRRPRHHRRRAPHHRRDDAKGTYAGIILSTKDLDETFEQQAGDAEIVQEPTDQPYGVRDCALRDPAGNLIRIQELR